MRQAAVFIPPFMEPQLQRAKGAARLEFKRRNDQTVLADLRQSGCFKIRLPKAQADRPVEAVMINTSGGLTDGDDLTGEFILQPGTMASLTTQAAERAYQARALPAQVSNHLKMEGDSSLFWLPQELIFFDGAKLNRRLSIDMTSSSRLLAVEQIIFGRTAMGERVENGSLEDHWDIKIDGKAAYSDHLSLGPAIGEQLSDPTMADGALSMASLVYAGPEAIDHLPVMQQTAARMDEIDGIEAAATCLGPVCLLRALGTDAFKLRREIRSLLNIFQRRLLRLPDQAPDPLPRVWDL